MPALAQDAVAGSYLRGFVEGGYEPSDPGSLSYGPKFSELYPDNMLNPTLGLTLADGSKYDVDILLKKVYHYTASIDCWELTVLPLRFMAGMVAKWEEEITQFTLLQVTPELVSPQLIEYERAVHSVAMEHMQQGFIMNGEWFMHPKGRQEFHTKREMLANNVVGTMQYAVKVAIIQSLDHWYNYQRKFGREFPNYHEAMAKQIDQVGALNLDEKAIYKVLHGVNEAIHGDVKTPQLDTMVAAKGLLPSIALGAGITFETEADRVGVKQAGSMLRSGGRAMSSHLPMKNIFEDTLARPTNKKVDDFNKFTMTYFTGAFGVLDGANKGKKDKLGRHPPEVQLVTIPGDSYQTFQQEEALDNDMRFEKGTGELNGSLYATFLASLPHYLRDGRFKFQDGMPPDMFVWNTKDTRIGGVDYSRAEDFALCEYYGDMQVHPRNVPEDWALGVGTEAKQQALERGEISQEDLDNQDRLRDACKSVYHLNNKVSGDTLKALLRATASAQAGGFDIEFEWGGYDGSIIVAAMGDQPAADYEAPYGFGSVALMMSFLKTVPASRRMRLFPNWAYNTLNYAAIKRSLQRIWEHNQKAFPCNAIASQRFVPIGMYNNFGTGTDAQERRRRASLFASFGEGLHYPTFVSKYMDNSQAAETNTFGNLFSGYTMRGYDLAQYATEDWVRADAAADDFKAAFEQWTSQPGAFDFTGNGSATWDEFLQYVNERAGLGFKERMNVVSATIGYVLGMMGPDGDEPDIRSVQPFTEGLVKKTFANLDAHRRGQTVTEDADDADPMALTLMTFSGKSWESGYVDVFGISAADTKDMSKPLISAEVFSRGSRARVSALQEDVNRMARSRLSRTAFAHAQAQAPHGIGADGDYPGNYPHGFSLRGSPDEDLNMRDSTFATEAAPHYVGAAAGFSVGGPFSSVVSHKDTGEAPTIAERRNMILAFDFIKKHCSDWFSRMCAFSYLASRINLRSLKALIKCDVQAPTNNLLVNPFIQLKMNLILFMKAGEETGFLAHNYAQSAFGQDPTHLQHKFNLVGWMVGVVTAPHNIVTCPTASFAGYTGGLGSRFFQTPEQYREVCKSRSQMASGPAMFSFSMPPTYTREFARKSAQTISLQGKLDAKYLGYRVDSSWLDKENQEPSWSQYLFYNHAIQFNQVNAERDYLDGSQEARRMNTHLSLNMHIRRARYWNPTKGEYVEEDQGTGPIDKPGPPPILPILSGGVTFDNTRNNNKA